MISCNLVLRIRLTVRLRAPTTKENNEALLSREGRNFMETQVVNLRQDKYDIYIGRPSDFGNPYVIGRDGDREKVIALFKDYFLRRVQIEPYFREAVMELKGKRLGCYCKPKPCHGDVIVEYLEGKTNETQHKVSPLATYYQDEHGD